MPWRLQLLEAAGTAQLACADVLCSAYRASSAGHANFVAPQNPELHDRFSCSGFMPRGPLSGEPGTSGCAYGCLLRSPAWRQLRLLLPGRQWCSEGLGCCCPWLCRLPACVTNVCSLISIKMGVAVPWEKSDCANVSSGIFQGTAGCVHTETMADVRGCGPLAVSILAMFMRQYLDIDSFRPL